MQYKVPIITINSIEEAQQGLSKMQKDNYSLILCDVITNQYRLEKSFKTILITSGTESIKHAFKEVLQITHLIENSNQQTQILEQTLTNQSNALLLLNANFKLHYSNIEQELQQSVLAFLAKKTLLQDHQIYYYSFKRALYRLAISNFTSSAGSYYLVEVKLSTPPLINNQFGIKYQHFDDIKQDISQQLTFTTFIEEENKKKAKRLYNYFRSILIFGESGTSKTSLAQYLFINQTDYNRNLITIDASVFNDKTWKFLTNLNNGPLIEIGNTLLFQIATKCHLSS